MLTRHGLLNRRRAASHENSKPAWVSQPHGPQISIGNSGRIQDQRRPTPNTIRIVTASHDPGYHRWLIGAIGKAPLAVLPAWSSAAALSTALHLRIAVVSFDDDLPGSDWRPFLKALDDMDTPPALIVTSRLADERLWAEVLNLGAFDLLSKPFDFDEATRIIPAAIRQMYPMFGSRPDYADTHNLDTEGEEE